MHVARGLHMLVVSVLLGSLLVLGTIGRTHAYVHARETAPSDCATCGWVKSAPPVIAVAAAPHGPIWVIASAVMLRADAAPPIGCRTSVDSRGPPTPATI